MAWDSLIFREAGRADAGGIAALHADSWRHAYRGILLDSFLDGDILQERSALWEQRLALPAANQFVWVAETDGEIKGLVCIYGAADARWGSLIDNLHVSRELKGQGIGKALMRTAAQWIHRHYPAAGMYLWVYEANARARRFYESLGAANVENILKENPGGGTASSFRYAWTTEKMSLLLP